MRFKVHSSTNIRPALTKQEKNRVGEKGGGEEGFHPLAG
jgi:hypothetical protein